MISIDNNILLADIAQFGHLEEFITNGWTYKMIEEAYTSDTSSFIKAVEDDKIVGYINYSIIIDEMDINSVVVLPEYRGRGIGRHLLEEAEKNALQQGVKVIHLEVNQNNNNAVRLYESFGFSLVYERKNYYGTESALVYKKMI